MYSNVFKIYELSSTTFKTKPSYCCVARGSSTTWLQTKATRFTEITEKVKLEKLLKPTIFFSDTR